MGSILATTPHQVPMGELEAEGIFVQRNVTGILIESGSAPIQNVSNSFPMRFHL